MDLAKICNKLSNMFRYECTYLDLKSKLKQAMRYSGYNYTEFVYQIDDRQRGIGKSRALAKLSQRYRVPVLVSSEAQAYSYKHGKYKPYKVFNVGNEVDMRGKQLYTVLIDEGFTNSQIEKYVKPCCCRIVGVSSADYLDSKSERVIKG